MASQEPPKSPSDEPTTSSERNITQGDPNPIEHPVETNPMVTTSEEPIPEKPHPKTLFSADANPPDQPPQEDPPSPSKPFPLLHLPPELRTQIYTHILSPTTTLHLHTTPTKRHAISPAITPSLLLVSRQIHHEASPLLYAENELILTIDAHETSWPIIAEARLPQGALEKIERLCVVIDCTAMNGHLNYGMVDFAPFCALRALKTLRLGLLYRRLLRWGAVEKSCGEEEDVRVLMAEILRRVPRDVEVLCGMEDGSEQERVLLGLKKRRDVGTWGMSEGLVVRELRETVESVGVEERGMLCGTMEDVYAESRASCSKEWLKAQASSRV